MLFFHCLIFFFFSSLVFLLHGLLSFIYRWSTHFRNLFSFLFHAVNLNFSLLNKFLNHCLYLFIFHYVNIFFFFFQYFFLFVTSWISCFRDLILTWCSNIFSNLSLLP